MRARRYLNVHLKVTQNCFVKLLVSAIIRAGSQSGGFTRLQLFAFYITDFPSNETDT